MLSSSQLSGFSCSPTSLFLLAGLSFSSAMILLRSSVFFLLCGIICCQESVSTAPTGDTKLHQPDDQHQETPTLTIKPEDSPRLDKEDKSVQSENASLGDGHESQPKPNATLDSQQVAAKRRQCCDDGFQHFYMNGHCAHRSKEKLEAVGPWCDQKFLECCDFMELYHMGGSRCRNKHRQKIIPEASPRKCEEDKSVQPEKEELVDNQEAQPKPNATPADSPRKDEVQEPVQSGNASLGDGHESQPKPNATLDSQQVAARRRQCCDDGRQHFYMNGNCTNRPREKNEAVGLWCDRKFLECCVFMESYYMGPVERRRCQNKHHPTRLPSPTDTSNVTKEGLNQ